MASVTCRGHDEMHNQKDSRPVRFAGGVIHPAGSRPAGCAGNVMAMDTGGFGDAGGPIMGSDPLRAAQARFDSFTG